jgi:hypothetical protein
MCCEAATPFYSHVALSRRCFVGWLFFFGVEPSARCTVRTVTAASMTKRDMHREELGTEVGQLALLSCWGKDGRRRPLSSTAPAKRNMRNQGCREECMDPGIPSPPESRESELGGGHHRQSPSAERSCGLLRCGEAPYTVECPSLSE